MSVRRRFIAGLGATALSPLVTTVVQLGAVPLLLRAWGPAKYGDWLVLSAIPSYLALSDLGFGNASGSDMTYRVAQGDRIGALETFQSSWLLLTAISMFALLLAGATVWLVPWSQWFRLSSLSSHEAAWVILTLGLFAVLTQQTSVLESGYRCDGNFAAGTLWWTVQKLAEACVATVIAVLGGSLLAVSVGYLLSRTLGTLAYGALLFRKSPWLRLGFKHARLSAVKALAKPAAGFVALPLGTAVSLQGSLLVIGATLGPVAATMFGTTRTLTRLNFQLVNTIARALWPELSSAFGVGNLVLARKLHRYACQATIGISGAALAFLWIAGPSLYHLWIRKGVDLNLTCFHILLIVAFLTSVWNTSSVVPMSTNQHQSITTPFLLISLLSLAVAWIITPILGISGTAISLILTDGLMCCLVLRAALRQLGDNVAGFTRSMTTFLPARRYVEQVR